MKRVNYLGSLTLMAALGCNGAMNSVERQTADGSVQEPAMVVGNEEATAVTFVSLNVPNMF